MKNLPFLVTITTPDGIDHPAVIRAADLVAALHLAAVLVGVTWPGAAAVLVEPTTPEQADDLARQLRAAVPRVG